MTTTIIQPSAPCLTPISPYNYALPNRASLIIPRLSFFNLNIVEFELPSMTLSAIARTTPFVTDMVPGDHINYSPLQVKFLVDEKYANYLDIYYWMVGLGKPRDRDQYSKKPNHREDCRLLIRDANQSVVRTVVFEQAWPSRIDEINFNFSVEQPKPIECVVEFLYTKYEFIPETF